MEEVKEFLSTFHESCISSVSLIDSLILLSYSEKDIEYSVNNIKKILKKYSMLMNDVILKVEDNSKIKKIKNTLFESLKHIEESNFAQSRDLLQEVAGDISILKKEICY